MSVQTLPILNPPPALATPPGGQTNTEETPLPPKITTPQLITEKEPLHAVDAFIASTGLSPAKSGLFAGLGLAAFYWLTSIRRLNLMALLTFLGAAGLGIGMGALQETKSFSKIA